MNEEQINKPNVSFEYTSLSVSQKKKARSLAKIISFIRHISEGIFLIVVFGTSLYIFINSFIQSWFDLVIVLFFFFGVVSLLFRLFSFYNKKFKEIDCK